jgi:protocatechuate 3,4-dioxygenase beta subunit
MSSKILVPLCSAVFLCIGVLIGYLLLQEGSGGEVAVPAGTIPAAGESRAPAGGKAEPLGQPDPGGLEAENEKLAKEVERLKTELEKAGRRLAETKKEVSRLEALPRGDTSPRTPGAAPAPPAADPSGLEPGKGGIEGRFIKNDGTPAASIRVTIYKHTGDFQSFHTPTDGSGYYRMGNLVPGSYEVMIRRDMKATCMWPEKYTEVAAGRYSKLDFGSEKNITVKGKALNAEGKSISGAILHLFFHGNDCGSGFVSYSARTDDEGRFTFVNLRPAIYEWNLQGLDRTSYGSGKKGFSKSGPFEWTIQMTSTQISGVVVDRESGKPLHRASIMTSRQEGRSGTGSYGGTDAEGRFKFVGLIPGTYMLTAFAQRYVVSRLDPIKLAEGQCIDDVRFALDPAAVFKARVVADDGRPIRDVDVRIHAIDEKRKDHYWPLHFEAGGIAEVDNLPPGQYTLEVTADGFEPDSKIGVILSKGDNPMLEFILKKR